MPISPRHLRLILAIPGITFPAVLDLLGRDGLPLTQSGLRLQASLEIDGTITALWLKPPNNVYDHPSALRAAHIEANGQTYTRFVYKGRALRDWGVR